MSDLLNQIRHAQVLTNLRRRGLAEECQTRAERDAPAALAASAAAQARAKAENAEFTQTRLSVLSFRVESAAYLIGEDRQAIARVINTNLQGRYEADARRLAACWNACEGVPTETLELAASWGDIVKGVMGGARISAEAAAVGAALDSESLEQGEVL